MVADAAKIEPGDVVLEIGPGDGALTGELLARGARVVAVEKDARLVPLLQEQFASHDVEVVEADALEFDTQRYFGHKPYKVVGNIPYYITGALFKKFLSAAHQPTTLVFLVQKEVAQRIARDKKESILSLSVKAYGTPKYVTSVPRGAFAPPPKVDSAIVAIEHVSRSNFTSAAHEQHFFELVKAGFASKRKLLASNVGTTYAQKFSTVGIDAKARAEDVSLAAWLALSK